MAKYFDIFLLRILDCTPSSRPSIKALIMSSLIFLVLHKLFLLHLIVSNARDRSINKPSINSEFMLGLFIDLSRAFDTISHKILLDKLYKYGIRGIALEWVREPKRLPMQQKAICCS